MRRSAVGWGSTGPRSGLGSRPVTRQQVRGHRSASPVRTRARRAKATGRLQLTAGPVPRRRVPHSGRRSREGGVVAAGDVLRRLTRAPRAPWPYSAPITRGPGRPHPVAPRCTAAGSAGPACSPNTGRARSTGEPSPLSRGSGPFAEEHTKEFVRGLVHSDGSRVLNRDQRRLPGSGFYEYPRYRFTHVSTDIIGLRIEAPERLEIHGKAHTGEGQGTRRDKARRARVQVGGGGSDGRVRGARVLSQVARRWSLRVLAARPMRASAAGWCRAGTVEAVRTAMA